MDLYAAFLTKSSIMEGEIANSRGWNAVESLSTTIMTDLQTLSWNKEAIVERGVILTDCCTRAEQLAWNSLLLQLGTCDAYEINGFVVHEPRFTWQERQHRGIQRQLDQFYLTMELCMQGGKLDIDITYLEFSDHRPIQLTLPLQRLLGPKKPSAIPKKFFMDPANNLQLQEQWKKYNGDLHSFTLQQVEEI
ncbi:hypothetical protein SELMODRAFT_431569 [Selaginella moellendorffii]|uniref:Endonuclease/exonuclease/phosphatase domain-containing protein n=1 Tax=Selaginella moellendorffii TaxID=88036 RepID=D8TD30_SELML|nr:hypothetical protein SELMODRAFT_431569 [Selaginella moellendorffii]